MVECPLPSDFLTEDYLHPQADIPKVLRALGASQSPETGSSEVSLAESLCASRFVRRGGTGLTYAVITTFVQ